MEKNRIEEILKSNNTKRPEEILGETFKNFAKENFGEYSTKFVFACEKVKYLPQENDAMFTVSLASFNNPSSIIGATKNLDFGFNPEDTVQKLKLRYRALIKLRSSAEIKYELFRLAYGFGLFPVNIFVSPDNFALPENIDRNKSIIAVKSPDDLKCVFMSILESESFIAVLGKMLAFD